MSIDPAAVELAISQLSGGNRMRLWLKEGGLCCYCRRPMSLDPNSKRGVTCEHIVAKAEGGQRIEQNIAGACRRCNYLRGHAPVVFFRHIVAAYGDNLPEMGTARFTALKASISRILNMQKTRIRLPYKRAA